MTDKQARTQHELNSGLKQWVETYIIQRTTDHSQARKTKQNIDNVIADKDLDSYMVYMVNGDPDKPHD